MSRGPGRVQRRVVEVLQAQRADGWRGGGTATSLAYEVFGEFFTASNVRSVGRAVATLSRSGGWPRVVQTARRGTGGLSRWALVLDEGEYAAYTGQIPRAVRYGAPRGLVGAVAMELARVEQDNARRDERAGHEAKLSMLTRQGLTRDEAEELLRADPDWDPGAKDEDQGEDPWP